MHIYIHGFASSGNATKGKILKDFFAGKENVISPDIPDEPFEAVKILEEFINNSKEPVTLWGSSLGGFYAIYLASKYDIKAVLINPAIKPYIGLKHSIGKVQRHGSDEYFDWKEEYIHQLESLSKEIFMKNIKRGNITLMLSKDDALLDYNETLKFLDGKIGKLIIEEKSGHHFMTFKEVLEREISR
jgi:predicted esterase YcpF (UPF0227 family)